MDESRVGSVGFLEGLVRVMRMCRAGSWTCLSLAMIPCRGVYEIRAVSLGGDPRGRPRFSPSSHVVKAADIYAHARIVYDVQLARPARYCVDAKCG
jgi:hypothetical protein